MDCETMYLCGKEVEGKDVQAKAEFLNLREDNALKSDFQDSYVATYGDKLV
jgi:hypothetical protein